MYGFATLPNKTKFRLGRIREIRNRRSAKSQASRATPVHAALGTSTPSIPRPTMATTTNSGSGQKQSASSSSSRFASLKVFKFAAGSSKHTPPIPPPKEHPLASTSCLSLVPDPSTPVTPVSPGFNITTARSQSTPPFSAAHSPALSSQDQAPSLAASTTSFGKGLIKFAKRSLTPKSVARQLSESSEESSISLPWGFQVWASSSDHAPIFAAYMLSVLSIPPLPFYIWLSVAWILVVDAAFSLFFALSPYLRCISCSITCMSTKGESSRDFLSLTHAESVASSGADLTSQVQWVTSKLDSIASESRLQRRGDRGH